MYYNPSQGPYSVALQTRPNGKESLQKLVKMGTGTVWEVS